MCVVNAATGSKSVSEELHRVLVSGSFQRSN